MLTQHKKLDSSTVEFCDSVAMRYLNFSEICAELNRQEIPDMQAFYYSQSEKDGYALIVCKDGSILHTNKSVPLELHIQAFKNGLRSSEKTLNKLLNK